MFFFNDNRFCDVFVGRFTYLRIASWGDFLMRFLCISSGKNSSKNNLIIVRFIGCVRVGGGGGKGGGLLRTLELLRTF